VDVVLAVYRPAGRRRARRGRSARCARPSSRATPSAARPWAR